MTDKRTQAQSPHSNMEKDPEQWTTGDEPMTGAQRSYLKTLCEEAKEPFDEKLTKAQASRRIDELQQKTGRGRQGLGGEAAAGNPGARGAAPGAAGGTIPGSTGGTPGAGGGKPGSTPGGTPGR